MSSFLFTRVRNRWTKFPIVLVSFDFRRDHLVIKTLTAPPADRRHCTLRTGFSVWRPLLTSVPSSVDGSSATKQNEEKRVLTLFQRRRKTARFDFVLTIGMRFMIVSCAVLTNLRWGNAFFFLGVSHILISTLRVKRSRKNSSIYQQIIGFEV